MQSVNEIRETLRRHRATVLEKYGMETVGIFRPYARAESMQGSDLDLLAEARKPIGLFDLVGAQIYLTEGLGRKVDLVPKQDRRSELRGRILDEAVPL